MIRGFYRRNQGTEALQHFAQKPTGVPPGNGLYAPILSCRGTRHLLVTIVFQQYNLGVGRLPQSFLKCCDADICRRNQGTVALHHFAQQPTGISPGNGLYIPAPLKSGDCRGHFFVSFLCKQKRKEKKT